MKDVHKLLIALLRAAVDEEYALTVSSLDDETLEALFKLSEQHSVTPIVAEVLSRQNLLGESTIKDEYKKALMQAIFRYQKQQAELMKLSSLFEQNEILHIPLKGAVLRNFYKEPWLRTSSDIDILVKPESVELASQLMQDSGYTYVQKGAHDVSFFSENHVHIELHFDVIEKEAEFANVNRVLFNIWDYAEKKSGKQYEYVLFDNMFYFYHIAHMAKHFVQGGCGVRPFLDLWILNHHVAYNEEKKNTLLQTGGILTFAAATEQLVRVWFSEEAETDVIKQMEQYLFSGGIYGNLENQIAMTQAETDSKLKSALSKIFLAYDTIKFQYPILQKHKWLLPFYEVKRWCKLIFAREHRTRVKTHLSINQNLSDDVKEQVKKLRKALEI